MNNKTIYSVLKEHKMNNPERIAYSQNERHEVISMSYGQLFDAVIGFGAFYQNLVYKRIGVLGTNSLRWIVNVLGIIAAGDKTVALLDPQMPLEDLTVIIQRCNIELIVCDSELADVAEAVCNVSGNITYRVMTDEKEEVAGFFAESNSNSEMLFFTSGTTQNSKIVVTPVEAIIGNVTEQVRLLNIDRTAHVLIPIPFNHSFGFAKNIQSLVAGNTIHISTMVRVLKDIKSVEPEIIYIVPSGAEFLVKKRAITPPLKHMIMAGSYLPPELAVKIKECGTEPHNEYGSSEIPGGLGISLDGDDVSKITPSHVVTLSLDSEGVLCVTTPNHFREYFEDPDNTRETLSKDTVYTGDAAEISADGKLHILGRKRNMIVMPNGEKLLYSDIDERIKKLEGVSDGAVVYVDGKLIAAVTLEESVSFDSVSKALETYNNTLPIYRRIRDIYELKEGLPYTSSGKLLRRKIEETIQEMI